MYTTYDVLVGILSTTAKIDDIFNLNRDAFHNFFYTRQNTYRVLRDLPFDTDGLYPRSSKLEDALDTLSQARLITTTIDFQPYFIQEACQIAYNTFCRKRFDMREQDELEELGKAFHKEFST